MNVQAMQYISIQVTFVLEIILTMGLHLAVVISIDVEKRMASFLSNSSATEIILIQSLCTCLVLSSVLKK